MKVASIREVDIGAIRRREGGGEGEEIKKEIWAFDIHKRIP